MQPTNHLDIEGLDALISAITGWNGGVIVISHDERFITSVAQELWVCNEGEVYKFKGDVQAYKVSLLCLSVGERRLIVGAESYCEQRQGEALKDRGWVLI